MDIRVTNDYRQNGYCVLDGLFKEKELGKLRVVVSDFHESWKTRNAQFYADKAVNSAYLTGQEHLNKSGRESLFKFIGSAKLMNVVSSVINSRPAFMNTQLFFNPVNKAQKNYWHRDPQYHLSIDEQKEALLGPGVVHFRIPLVDEPGIELVPGTHKRWDTDEELDVRLERNGRKNHNDLSTGVRVKLKAGDLLVFSAHMIHRGIYGMERMALDILFCDPSPDLMTFVDNSCLPDQNIIEKLENPTAFVNTIKSKALNHQPDSDTPNNA